MTDDLGRGSYKIDADATGAEQELDKVEAETKTTLNNAEKAASDAGNRTLTKLGTLGRASVKTIALGASATFAALSGLALQGEQAMAKFQAETGATADEAKAALRDMNTLAGQNLQSFSDVADVLTQVRTQMGLTGDEGRDMADSILKFSTATGQAAQDAVLAFDDIGDAWNLSATEQKQVMDALVVSHQKYGGAIQDSEELLKNLAPTLQAANMSWEDATALLNLFNHAGVGAEAAATGLNRALGKVKSPEELQALIKDVAATEDPFERAQKAADLFGARAGPKLAQALADSGGDLQQFGVSADEAAGAVDKAASAIENTLPNKVKMAVNGALASLRNLGTDFGPALTGAASLVSLGTSFASALKLDRAIPAAFKAAIGSPAMTSALNSLAGRIGVVVGGGLIAGEAFNLAMETINKQLGVIPDDIDKAVHEAYLVAQQGGPYVAKAFADTYQKAIDEGLSKQDAYQKALQAEKDALTAAATLWANVTQKLIADPFAHDTSFVKKAGEAGVAAGHATGDGLVHGIGDRLGKGWNMTDVFDHDTSFKAGVGAGTAAGEGIRAGVRETFHGPGRGTFVDQAEIEHQGEIVGQLFAQGLKSTKGDVASAMADLRDALQHPLRGIKTVAKVEGALSSKALADGLQSQDPYIRAKAESTRDGLLAKLRALQAAGYDIGKKGMDQLGQGITDGAPAAKKKATGAATTVKNGFDAATKGWYADGKWIGGNWAAGIAAAITASVRGGAINDALVRMNNRMQVASPSPKEGPLHGVEKGGYATGRNYALALGDGLASVGLNKALGTVLPGMGLSATSTVLHTGTVQVRLTGDTMAAARAQGASWADVGAMAAAAVVDVAGVVRDMSRMRAQPISAGVG